MSRDVLRVAVVGGGIAGLATANALVARGIEVTVYEQAPELGEVGAGVMITPQAVRQLHRLGLGAAVSELGAPLGPGSAYQRMDGTPVAPVRVTDTSGAYRGHGMHRADLLRMLADRLPAGTVRTGHRCTGFGQDGRTARLTFANGVQAEADAVIAADGIHSALRPYAVPESEPVYSGSVAYRGLVDADALPGWPRDAHLIWMGDGKHFMVFPVRGGTLFNYVGFLPSEVGAAETWSGTGDPVALAAAFAGWDDRIGTLLAEVTEPFWWGLYDREPLPRWTDGRLTLLGDAAHPMLPHLGQGANQAIEDGVALAVLLAGAGRGGVPAALRAYEDLRRPRVAQVQRGARVNGARYDSRSQYADHRRRDAEMSDHTTFRAWLYDYDVRAEADRLAAAGA